jgi:putative multiple sugar transport system substrate-binding protein
MVFTLAVFGQAAPSKYVGIAMPTQSSERWIKDGHTMKDILEKRGYKADLQYAEDDIPTQKAQIENMISKGAKVLVIAAIDGSTLSATLDNASKSGVKIISYDRLLVIPKQFLTMRRLTTAKSVNFKLNRWSMA